MFYTLSPSKPINFVPKIIPKPSQKFKNSFGHKCSKCMKIRKEKRREKTEITSGESSGRRGRERGRRGGRTSERVLRERAWSATMEENENEEEEEKIRAGLVCCA